MTGDPENTPTTSRKSAAPKAASSKAPSDGKKAAGSGRRTPVRLDSPRWLVPVMITCFVLGLIWIVAYYVAPDAPVISTIGWWNVLIGFGFFTVGFFLSTKWK